MDITSFIVVLILLLMFILMWLYSRRIEKDNSELLREFEARLLKFEKEIEKASQQSASAKIDAPPMDTDLTSKLDSFHTRMDALEQRTKLSLDLLFPMLKAPVEKAIALWQPWLSLASDGLSDEISELAQIKDFTELAERWKKGDTTAGLEIIKFPQPGSDFISRLWVNAAKGGGINSLFSALDEIGFSSKTILPGSVFDSSFMEVVERTRTGQFSQGKVSKTIVPPLFDKNGICIVRAQVVLED